MIQQLHFQVYNQKDREQSLEEHSKMVRAHRCSGQHHSQRFKHESNPKCPPTGEKMSNIWSMAT